MTQNEHLITEHFDIWSAAVTTKSASGRGKSNKLELYGLKKLRELILELAVRGLLVPQNPEDEPASALLKKIAAEKAKLIKELPPISEDEKPFELPDGWEWVRLKAIGHDWGQKTPNSEFTYIDVGAINKELGIISEPRILQGSEAPSRARKIVKQGTVIYSTVRPCLLNIAIINKVFEPEPIASTAFAIIHPFKGIHPSFIYRYLRSPAFISYVESCQTGIAYPAVNDKQFFSGIFPLPPTEEQHRIVAKVDELMALCDQLEHEQETSISAHHTLVHTLLTALATAGEQGHFDEAWARIAEHFDILFTTESSIDQLKQTILQLAVMGKLAPQHPDDEPASALLKNIAAEKARLIKAGKLKKHKKLPPISENEKPFDLPDGWEWVRLKAIGHDWGQKTPNSEFTYIDVGAINKELGIISDPRILQASEAPSRARKIVKQGTVIYSTVRPYLLNIAIINKVFEPEPIASTAFAIIHPFKGIHPSFIYRYLRSPAFISYVESCQTGIAYPAVNDKQFFSGIFPLPPTKEQHRIVAKVDELMALCDRLKERITAARATQRHLADAMAEQATG